MKRLLAVALCFAAPVFAQPVIPYERFTLPNGLRVIVHEDHKAPIVAVRVAYHVGGKDEPTGKTGFAHLFEHLMFKGTENFKGDFFQTLDNVGASGVNAETTLDTTQYFEVVPRPALEMTLWLESERMGHFVSGINQQMLKTELGVVQNEKRDREGGPLGPLNGRVMAGLFPEGHPYRRPVLGSMDDLNAAAVADVQAWFRSYYGATNTVVVLAGDIDVKTARPLIEKYFSDVPAGEPLYRMKAWVPQLAHDVHESMQARVAQGSVQRYWPAPPPNTRDYTLLTLAASILGGTLKDRLYGELVEKQKLSSSASAGLEAFEIASIFSIGVDLKPDADAVAVHRTIDEQLALFLKQGPTRKELQKIKSDLEAFQLLGLQGVAGKAQVLAGAELYTGDPAFNERAMEWTRQATAEDIRHAASLWLRKPSYQVDITPFGDYQVTAARFDRSVMPTVVDDLDLKMPPIEEDTLSNGMKLALAQRHEVPSITMTMVFAKAGNNADQGRKLGTAATTYTLMSEGPAGLRKVDYAEKLDALHASISIGAGAYDAASGLSVLKKNLRPALALWQQVLREPALRQADLDDWRTNARQDIANARVSPDAVASRIFLKAIYPEGHFLAPRPDQEALVRAIDMRDLKNFHATWLRPDIVKLFIVGDTTMPEIKRELERVFADWKAPPVATPAVPAILPAPVPSQPRFILVDWPGEDQVQISGGRFVMPAGTDDARLLSAANDILGGGTTARLGQRLRVEKGWSYGINSASDGDIVQQYWGIVTSVQSDRAARSVAEILDVIAKLTGPQPGADRELARFVKGQSRGLPGLFEDSGSVLGAMVQSDAFGRPYDWIEGTKARLNALRLDDVNRVAREYFTPHCFTWVLVGDLSKFEQELRGMKLGSVEVWDREGNRVR